MQHTLKKKKKAGKVSISTHASRFFCRNTKYHVISSQIQASSPFKKVAPRKDRYQLNGSCPSSAVQYQTVVQCPHPSQITTKHI